ncbi:MAG: right-handed parallel beta-helix repeat-containing protein [Betaproteobacteria bacterium]|nr:right-handed parallel beta-helix repeat-containing protein [Betaproteobacteria bacterium]
MLRRAIALPIVALVLSMLTATSVMAVGQRTFVASYGDDLNPCTLQLPCRAFLAAMLQTNPGGEVIVLDSAGYGPVTITKAVSVIAPPGVYAGMSPTAGVDGIVVAAGPSDKVVLRGLTINGQGGNRGIVITSAGEVHIEQCTVANMGQDGIQINGGARVHIRSSTVRSNGWRGLAVLTGSPAVQVLDSQFANNTLAGVHIVAGTLDAARIAANENFAGIVAVAPPEGATVVVTVSDSVASGNATHGTNAITNTLASAIRMAIVRTTSARNGSDGFGAYTQDVGTVFLSVSDSVSVGNVWGLTSSGLGATAVITRSTFADNVAYDIVKGSTAVLRTSGNNTLTGTGTTVSGAYTPNPLF